MLVFLPASLSRRKSDTKFASLIVEPADSQLSQSQTCEARRFATDLFFQQRLFQLKVAT